MPNELIAIRTLPEHRMAILDQKLLPDAGWQACRIHFGRNIARRVRPGKRQLALAAYSAIYIQPDRERAVSACHAFAAAMERLDPRPGITWTTARSN